MQSYSNHYCQRILAKTLNTKSKITASRGGIIPTIQMMLKYHILTNEHDIQWQNTLEKYEYVYTML